MTDQAPTLDQAISRAQEWLDRSDGGERVSVEEGVPNPLQGLLLVPYVGAAGAELLGAVLVVTETSVYPLDSNPAAPERIGAQWADDEEYDDDDDDDAEMSALVETFGLGEFGPPGQEFDETVCIMAIPAEDDPVHGIGPEDKHATLLYFGDRSKSADPARIEGSRGLFLDVLRTVAAETEPFEASVTGIEPLGHDDRPAQVWLLDSPDLRHLFEEIPEVDSEIASMYEDADATRYPEYRPHVTIGYGEGRDDGTEADEDGEVSMADLAEAAAVQTVRFDRLSLWWGNEHVDVPLGAEAAELAALLDTFGTE